MKIDTTHVAGRSTILPTALIIATFACPAYGQQAGSGSGFTGDELKALPPRMDHQWRQVYNQRYSPLTDITPDNIGELKGVWRVRLDGSGVGLKYSGEATPIVHEGVVYVVTGADDVFAISVDSGERLWKYEADLDQSISTVCCGWTSRGVAIGEGRVYVGQLDGKLVALDQATGEIAWSVQAERWQDGYTITSAPLYYDGMVITGFAGAEYATRGRVKAYDAKDGSDIWTFYTVPGPGEFGHDTWAQDNEVWRYGGATVWQAGLDPDLDLVYFSTVTPGPTSTARDARETTSSRLQSLRSTHIPATTAGIFSRFTTISGTMTRRTRSFFSTSTSTVWSERRPRRRARPDGFTFSTARRVSR